MKKYKKTDNDNFTCGYLKKQVNYKGNTVSECENMFYKEKFIKNNDCCPSKCPGRVYSDVPQSLELIFSADGLFCAKKITYLIGTIFAELLTILNIIDKI